jgi:hypothetical protein
MKTTPSNLPKGTFIDSSLPPSLSASSLSMTSSIRTSTIPLSEECLYAPLISLKRLCSAFWIIVVQSIQKFSTVVLSEYKLCSKTKYLRNDKGSDSGFWIQGKTQTAPLIRKKIIEEFHSDKKGKDQGKNIFPHTKILKKATKSKKCSDFNSFCIQFSFFEQNLKKFRLEI